MTQTLDQATWDAKLERVHAHYKAVHDESLQNAKLQFIDVYDSAVSQVVLVSIGILILMLFGMIWIIVQHSATCTPPV